MVDKEIKYEKKFMVFRIFVLVLMFSLSFVKSNISLLLMNFMKLRRAIHLQKV